MNCGEVENLLPDYLSDNLDGDARSRMEAHLRQCDGCTRKLSGMRRMIAELGRLEKVAAPPDFLARVHRKASARRRHGKIFETLFVPFKWKVPLQLTAMAALGVLIFFMVPYQRQGPETGSYLRQAPAPQLAMKKEMPQEGAFPEPASEVENIAQDQKQPPAGAPAPHVAMKKEMPRKAASPEPAPEMEKLAQEKLPAETPESSAIAERDEALRLGAAISSQVAIPVVLRVASAEQIVKAQSRHAPAFDAAPAPDYPSAKPRKLSKARPFRAKSMALDEAKKDAVSLAESEPADEPDIGGIEKEEAPTKSPLRKGGLSTPDSLRYSEIDGKKDRPASEQFDSRLRLVMEKFGAVEVVEPEGEEKGPAGPRRLTIRLPSENYRPFIDRLETLGVVETPPPPLPHPSPESVVLDLIMVYEQGAGLPDKNPRDLSPGNTLEGPG